LEPNLENPYTDRLEPSLEKLRTLQEEDAQKKSNMENELPKRAKP
jgi:hypothetical protein